MTPGEMSSTIGSEALKAIFKGASSRLDRMPALQTAFERTAALCLGYVRDAADPSPELILMGLETGIAAEVLAQHEDVSIVGTVNAPQWGTRALLSADQACVFTLIELLLGGSGVHTGVPTTDRGFSKIEIGIMRRFFERVAAALETAFAPIAKSTFLVEAAGDRLDLDAIGRKHTPVVVARFRLRVWERTGEILFVVPRGAIENQRQALGRVVSEETKRTDPRWSSQIKDEITRTSVTLSGVLDERLVPLQEIADFKVGEILQLNATAATRVRVECNGEPLLWCELGKSNGAYTLRVQERIDRDQEFVNDILAG